MHLSEVKARVGGGGGGRGRCEGVKKFPRVLAVVAELHVAEIRYALLNLPMRPHITSGVLAEAFYPCYLHKFHFSLYPDVSKLLV